MDFSTLVTDRMAADVAAKNAKGTYNYTDLNRVQDALEEIRTILVQYGYSVTPAELREWAENELPRISDMELYIGTILELKPKLILPESSIALPVSMDRLTYISANNIEIFLSGLRAALDRIPPTWVYSGEVYGGEI